MMRCLVCGAEMYVTEVVEDGKRYGRSSASSLSSFARSAVAFRKHSLAVTLAAEPPSGSA